MEGVQQHSFDFYGFDRELLSLKSTKSQQVVETPFSDLNDAMRGVDVSNLQVTETEKVELTTIEPGITFIKSPKGSGKTTFLTRVAGVSIPSFNSLEQYEEEVDYEIDVPFSQKDKVLLIGHRRALIGELCSRIGLNCYLDDEKFSLGEIAKRRRQYGICLDSLAKVRDLDYDVILIDEVEQVLAHFMSATLGDRREGLFRLFSKMLNSAKKVVALDADIGWISFITLTVLTQPRVPKGQKINAVAVAPKPVHIYINNRKSFGSTLNLYSSLNQLIQKIVESAVDGKRIFVASNSKEKIDTLDHALKEAFKNINQEIPIKIITSNTSGEDHVQEFIKNIKKEILNFRVILSSPSLGTGVDITFENDAKEIDCVFGIFENRINSHFEIDQQLSRVRHPKEVNVWISPQTFNFETEFDVVKSDYMYERFIEVLDEGFVTNSGEIYPSEVSPFYQLAAMVLATDRASKNRLKANFLEYKIRQGWKIVPVIKDDNLIDQGKEIMKKGKSVKESVYQEHILDSRTLNQLEFIDFSQRIDLNDGTVSEDERYSMNRTRLELYYGQQVTKQLLEDDENGVLRRQIELYELLQKVGQEWQDSDIDHSPKNMLLRYLRVAAQLLHLLFSKTPMYSNGKFDPNVSYTGGDLVDFVKESKRLKTYVQTQLGIDLRSDIDEKPVTHLGSLLKKIGLVQIKSKKPIVSNGHKTYYYGVSRESIMKIETITQRRMDPQRVGWNFVNKLYGFHYSLTEMDQIMEGNY
jgi:energy-coupling factor transporter ATP-binding protein EcfA2